MSAPFYHETQVADGPLVLSHAMESMQSVALGIFIDVGSRDESQVQAGITHALEHMLFKGTKQMDVDRLAEKLDELGGNANAFTSRERTCFHLHVLREQWREALDILTRMVLEPALPEDEWQREREVIFAEMAMVDDTPEEWIMDQHIAALFPNHELGRPVLGGHQPLNAMHASDLRDYLNHHYCADKILITAAGHIDHSELVDAVSLFHWRSAESAASNRTTAPDPAADQQLLPRDGEQAQMVLSFPGIRVDSDQRPCAWLANQILGGGMSSRLFREIREKRGLAYSVGSHLGMFSDAGIWSISCGTEPERAADCAVIIQTLLDDFATSISQAELERANRQFEVQFRMGLDSVEGQMLYLGGRLDEEKLISTMQWLDLLAAVDLDELRAWCASHLSRPGLWSIAAPEQALEKISDTIRR